MRKVIFVAGTEYSGSTFFHLILAHDAAGFACGEIHNLFFPRKPHHFSQKCACGKQPCDIWEELRPLGDEQLFARLFDRFPEIRFIVSSSKDPLWIRRQNRLLAKQGIAAENLVIWKTPDELAASYAKRHRSNPPLASWTRYYRLYMSCVRRFRSIRYTEFAKDPGALQRICECIDIPFYHGKEEYWNGSHHSLGGNISARVHLYESGSRSYEDLKQKLQAQDRSPEERSAHRGIYSNPETETPADDSLAATDSDAQLLLRMLHAHDYAHGQAEVDEPAFRPLSGWGLRLRQYKRRAQVLQARLRQRRGGGPAG